MVRKNNKVKKGFTIIEVVLVLAIAGLIFLMVFIALPALQRSQRNTQRRDDYSMLVTAINNYLSSNNGKINNLVGTGATIKQLQPERWVNSTGLDPSGNPYEVRVYKSGAYQFTADGEKPQEAPEDKLKEDLTIDGEPYGHDTPASQVYVVIKANCNGTDQNGDPKPKEDTANRSFAVYGYLEGGGYFCQASGSSGSNASGSDSDS